MRKTEEYDLRQRRHRKVETEYGVFDFGSTYLWNRKEPTGSLPNSVGYGLIIFFLILLKFFHDFENTLPDQIKLKDADSYPDRFIGERAELQLKRLTDLGPRVVGSYENEALVVDFLKREILFITQETYKNHKIEVDVQMTSGSYSLKLKQHEFRNCYAYVQNVVVKLSSGNNTNSVLMNCHYDTVPESPGASDNGVNCVVMLEILRVLATSTAPLKNNVIFLFNGAEENPLQASHGFVNEHKWRNEVKAVINLDSAGAGGREVLFQTSGEAWLVKAYARVVPRPTAGVQAQELFEYGIIPSDTDFRIFRDFGGYSGFDIAHCTNGYIYHTKFDTMDFVQPGVYQNTGDNMLALVRELVNSSELGTSQPKSRIVYYDVFTLFMVVYTEGFGIVLNLATVCLSVWVVYKSFKNLRGRSAWKKVLVSTGGQMLGLLLALAVVFFISKCLDYYKSTMSWYLRPWLIVPLYCFPIVFTLTAVLALTQAYMKKDMLGHRIIHFINGAQLLWTFILLIGTLKGILTSYILTLFVSFPSLGIFWVNFSGKSHKVKTYLKTYFICLALPTIFMVHQAVKIFTVMIPMTARMGPQTNPEVIIGGLSFLSSVLYLSQLVPCLLLLRKLKRFLISLCIFHLITMVAVIGTRYGFPYDENVRGPALQRFYVLHCERTFHDANGSVRKSDSGIFVQSLDRNNINYVAEFLPELQGARTGADECDTEIFCGFPVFTSRFIGPAPYSFWIPSPPPTFHRPTSFEVVSQTQMSVNIRRIRISITGPDHITVGLSPRTGVELVKWSFDPSPPMDIYSWNERKVYMVYYSDGYKGGKLQFSIDLKIDQNHSDNLMDVVVIGHYMHDTKFQTIEFKRLLEKFPNWAHLTPWKTTYDSWVI